MPPVIELPKGVLGVVEASDLPNVLAAGDSVVIDVRSDEERADGYLAGSLHIPSEQWDLRGGFHDSARSLVESVADGSKRLIFHCMYSSQRGPRAARAALEFNPDLRVAVLRGGFQKALTLMWEQDTQPPMLEGVRRNRWAHDPREGLVWGPEYDPMKYPTFAGDEPLDQ